MSGIRETRSEEALPTDVVEIDASDIDGGDLKYAVFEGDVAENGFSEGNHAEPAMAESNVLDTGPVEVNSFEDGHVELNVLQQRVGVIHTLPMSLGDLAAGDTVTHVSLFHALLSLVGDA